MEQINLIFQQQFLANTIQEYLIFVVLFFVLIGLFKFIKMVVLSKLQKIVGKTKNNFDDIFVEVFKNISKTFYIIFSIYLSSQVLFLPLILKKIIFDIFIAILIWEIIKLSQRIIKYFFNLFSKQLGDEKQAVVKAGSTIVNMIIYIISFLVLLSFLGVDITSLVAGLGIGGIAIAFALKEILADLFSYFTIILDEPIKLGDYISINGKSGSVQKIGIKTTRLIAPDGGRVIISNNLISSGLFENGQRREYRRVKFNLGVAYDTPVKKLKKIKPFIQKIIEKEEKGEFLRTFFKNFGDSALTFAIDYRLAITDYDEYVEAKERINFAILEFCEKEGIEIAYPTMTIYQK